jgi:hypothetical protein
VQRFQPSRPDKLVTSLADAVNFVVDANPTIVQESSELSA